jgi:ABC-type dipeptide/oligopeptide/nickel transport system permease subunit
MLFACVLDELDNKMLDNNNESVKKLPAILSVLSGAADCGGRRRVFVVVAVAVAVVVVVAAAAAAAVGVAVGVAIGVDGLSLVATMMAACDLLAPLPLLLLDVNW